MRILIVTEHFWPEAFRVNDLATGLRDRGHAVEVLTTIPNYPAGRYFAGYRVWGPLRERWEGIRIRRVPVIPRGGGQAWRLALNYGSFAPLAAAAVLLARRSWDAVLVFQPSPVTTILPALLARSARVPLVTWVQDLWPETLESTGLLRSPRLLRAAAALSRWLYRRCDRLLVQSRGYVGPLERAGVPRERIEFLPNWAEDLYASPRARDAAPAAQRGGFRVLFAGNLGRVQALETVLEAAGMLKEHPARWIFAGDGALREWLAEEVRRRRLEDRVSLLGWRPVEEMPALFESASAMLVSLKREPILAMTIPSKIQSYLAAARPLIGSLDGEGALIIEESGAGFASPAGDAEGLAASVLRMMALSEDERARMGRAGRSYYDAHFSRSACLSALESTLSRLHAARTPAGELA